MYITRIGIDGMMCGQCESHVSLMLRKIDGALIVKASHFKKEATIFSPRQITEEEALNALDGSGYKIISFSSNEREKEPLSYRFRLRKYSK